MVATQVVGGTKTQREFNMGLERKFLDKLYELQQPGQEFPASYIKMAELTGIPSNIVGNVIQFLENSNLLTRRFEWPHEAGEKRSGGRQAYWTLMTGHDHAANLLDKFHSALAEGKVRRRDIQAKGNPWLNGKQSHGGRKNGQMELPSITASIPEPMTGPELQTDNRKNPTIRDVNLPDEVSAAKTVVENVRNYLNAQQLAKANLAQLRAAGMNVNEEAYFASIQMTPNAEADAIALVMPYIEFCESKVEYYRDRKSR